MLGYCRYAWVLFVLTPMQVTTPAKPLITKSLTCKKEEQGPQPSNALTLRPQMVSEDHKQPPVTAQKCPISWPYLQCTSGCKNTAKC